MAYDFSQDSDFHAISQRLALHDGLLKDAWVTYKGETWHPVIVKDRQSGIRGFEINVSGKWGPNNEVGRKKLGLSDFLAKLADGSMPTSATIRCKRPGSSNPHRNARDLSDLALSKQLGELIARLRSKRYSPAPSEAPLETPTRASGSRQPISIEELEAQLDRRSAIGAAGELVALEHEMQRLKSAEIGCPDPENYVKHVALTDVGRGYDIESTWPGHERYIEVKSSVCSSNAIFMSDNERTVLGELQDKAWLYRVSIDASGKGEVILRLKNPIAQIPDENFSTAVWRVRLPDTEK